MKLQKNIHAKNSLEEETKYHMYIDVASVMTGVSLFTQRELIFSDANINWSFVKAGYEEKNKNSGGFSKYTHLLTEESSIEGFHEIDKARGNPRLDFRTFQIATEDVIYVMERDTI